MGKGIALQFKQKFPADYFNDYKLACQNGELAIGSVEVYELKNAQTNPRFIINFPTKRHWRQLSRIGDKMNQAQIAIVIKLWRFRLRLVRR
jgi:O-acetyl-ADP-ribose deacetylase (regulator of RNase III)